MTVAGACAVAALVLSPLAEWCVSVGGVRLAAGEAAAAAGVVIATYLVLGGGVVREWGRRLWPGVMFVLWAVVSAGVGVAAGRVAAGAAVKECIQAALYLVGAPLLFSLVLTEERWRRSAGVAAVVMGDVLALFALVQWLSVGTSSAATPEWAQAMRALLPNNHLLSFFLAASSVVAFAGAVGRFPTALRVSAAVSVVLQLLPVANAALLGCALLGMLMLAAGRPLRVAGVLAAAVAAVVLVPGKGGALFESVSVYSKWGDRAVVSYRYRRLYTATNIVRRHPVSGVGAGGFQAAAKRLENNLLPDEFTPVPMPPENITASRKFVDGRYQLAAAEGGLVGFFLLVLVVVHAFRLAGSGAGVASALLACVGSSGLFVDFMMRGTGIVLGAVLGACLVHGGRRCGRYDADGSA